MTTPVGGNVTVSAAVKARIGKTLTVLSSVAAPVGKSVSVLAALADEQAINAGFLFDMDLALRDHLKGIKVYDRESGGVRSSGSAGRPVFVYFANGETEVQERSWPFITVSLSGFNRAAGREHRGQGFIGSPGDTDAVHYGIGGVTDPAGAAAAMDEWPIPYDFTWLVQAHSRNFLHDRQIMLALEQDDKIPTRFGHLQVNDTVRILTRDAGPIQTDYLVGSPPKRVFRKTYTVSATAEFYRSALLQYGTIQHVNLGNIALL